MGAQNSGILREDFRQEVEKELTGRKRLRSD
jgi:hypothetical protein